MTTETLVRDPTPTSEPDLAADNGRDRAARPRGRRRSQPRFRRGQGRGVARCRGGGASPQQRRSSPPMPATSPRPRAQGLSAALRDRLALDPKRLEAIAAGLEAIAALARSGRPRARRMDAAERARDRAGRVPLGVIGIIYESRPNVTADAGGLALKSGNAAILRGGSESFHSSRALVAALRRGAARRRPAGRRDPAGADPRPRRGRADARR